MTGWWLRWNLCGEVKHAVFVPAVTCAVMQKTGAGLHTANSCYWDTTLDGRQLRTSAVDLWFQTVVHLHTHLNVKMLLNPSQTFFFLIFKHLCVQVAPLCGGKTAPCTAWSVCLRCPFDGRQRSVFQWPPEGARGSRQLLSCTSSPHICFLSLPKCFITLLFITCWARLHFLHVIVSKSFFYILRSKEKWTAVKCLIIWL